MKTLAVIIVLLLITLTVITTTQSEHTKKDAIALPTADKEILLTYFIETVTEKVTTTFENYHQQGLGGGVDGFTLIKTYPNLIPSDFINVIAYQGNYSSVDGKLTFTGNAASNSAVIERKGMKTLLENCAKRLGIELRTKGDIDELVSMLQSK